MKEAHQRSRSNKPGQQLISRRTTREALRDYQSKHQREKVRTIVQPEAALSPSNSSNIYQTSQEFATISNLKQLPSTSNPHADNMSEFMSGVSIAQIRPVAQRSQHGGPVKPPRPLTNNFEGSESNQHLTKRYNNKKHRPTSCYQNNGGTRKRIAQNVVGLKDLLWKGGISDENSAEVVKKAKKRSGSSSRVNLQFPIGNIQNNTYIIQINNQPVKLPQSDLSFVMDETPQSSQQVASSGKQYAKINRRIRLKNPHGPTPASRSNTDLDNEDTAEKQNQRDSFELLDSGTVS